METERVGRGLIRALGDLMEEELEAATDLQLTENITQMGLDGFLADAELRRDLFIQYENDRGGRGRYAPSRLS